MNDMSDPKRQSIEPGSCASSNASNQLHTKHEAEVRTEAQEQNITGMRLAFIIAAIISAIFLVALVSAFPSPCRWQ
jgi:cobalamin biosynthesis Mg chelatase CobN